MWLKVQSLDSHRNPHTAVAVVALEVAMKEGALAGASDQETELLYLQDTPVSLDFCPRMTTVMGVMIPSGIPTSQALTFVDAGQADLPVVLD